MLKRLFPVFLVAMLLSPHVRAAEMACTNPVTEFVPPVNVRKVQEAWLSWTNRVRQRLKLQPYVLDDYLNSSAMNWSAYAVKRGTIDHKRSPDASYYDYKAIEGWFAGRGLEFANVNGITFTENTGWGVFTCKQGDCTQKLIRAIRSTFTFFMAERAKQSRPHYNSIVQKDFRKIGIGFAYSPAQARYYLTVHYGTAITSEPPKLCKE